MENLIKILEKDIGKLSEQQKEEIYIVESIIRYPKEADKGKINEVIINYIKKRRPENCIMFIFGCINTSALINNKDREPLI